MLREIIQSQLPLLIIICLLTYLVYYLHKRILRIETYLKKINENQLIQQKEINNTQIQVAQVAQPVIPEPSVPSYHVEQAHVEPVIESTQSSEPVNPFLSLFAALQKEMNAPRQQPSRIEEIDDESDVEEDEEDEDDEDDQDVKEDSDDDESVAEENDSEDESQILHQPTLLEQPIESETEEHHENEHEDEPKTSSKKNFNKMTVKELQVIAIENGLNVMKKTRKELISMLEEKANSA
jgi:hypothetical protein